MYLTFNHFTFNRDQMWINNMRRFNYLINVFLIWLPGLTFAFYEEALFGDEHIYGVIKPQHNFTGMTAPGTKWCGPGNTTTSYNELGTEKETDMCCRDHDYCPDIIEGRSALHGISNTDLFPILNCNCEKKFLKCLQNVNTPVANTLGHLYFTARSLCFQQGYPIVQCRTYQNGSLRKRCMNYVVDASQSKIWQLYDMPFYYSVGQLSELTDKF